MVRFRIVMVRNRVIISSVLQLSGSRLWAGPVQILDRTDISNIISV